MSNLIPGESGCWSKITREHGVVRATNGSRGGKEVGHEAEKYVHRRRRSSIIWPICIARGGRHSEEDVKVGNERSWEGRHIGGGVEALIWIVRRRRLSHKSVQEVVAGKLADIGD